MDNAERMHAFHVRVSDDVIIRRCNTLVIDAPDSLAAIEIARRRAIMGEIDMLGSGDESYTPFSFQIVEQAPKPRHAVMRPENKKSIMNQER